MVGAARAMDLIVATAVVIVLGAGTGAYRAYRARRGRRPPPLRNDLVAGVVATARTRLLARVDSFEHTALATAADDGRWVAAGGGLTLADPHADDDDLAELALAFAAAQARRAAAGVDEARALAWLHDGATNAIAIIVQARLEKMSHRLARLQARPPPGAAELAELRRANDRDRAALDALLGARVDTSGLPAASVRRR
ncbi:MAG: hypothetical protein R3B06_28140 [Kofleriaceae bacterium]